MDDTTPDPVAAYLAEVRNGFESGLDPRTGPNVGLCRANAERGSALLGAVEVVLKAHTPVQIYESADGCAHPEPPEPEDGTDDGYTEHDRWYDDHPAGDDASGESVRLCHLTPRHSACRGCTELVYEHREDADYFVDAGDCIVRPVISAALLRGAG